MDRTVITWEGRQTMLLDEVDIISSVSGGSLAAADFIVNRENHFPGFEERVLGLGLQSKTEARRPGGIPARRDRRISAMTTFDQRRP